MNFSIFSEVAERIDLCLFDENGAETTLTLPERTAFCWHGYVPGLRPGQRYGFRVFGPWRPKEGLRCNPAKLLLDPYARAIVGEAVNQPAIFGHVIAPDGSATTEPNTDHWGADHCIDSDAVPGVIFANRDLREFGTLSFRDIPFLAIGKHLDQSHIKPPSQAAGEGQKDVGERLKGLGYL